MSSCPVGGGCRRADSRTTFVPDVISTVECLGVPARLPVCATASTAAALLSFLLYPPPAAAAAAFAARPPFPRLRRPSPSPPWPWGFGFPTSTPAAPPCSPRSSSSSELVMAGFRSLFASFRTTLFLLFLHLGCIFFSPASATPSTRAQPQPQPKRRKISPLSHHQSPSSSPPKPPRKSLSLSIRSYVRHLFTSFPRPSRSKQERQSQALTSSPVVVPPCTSAAQPQLHDHLVGDSEDNPKVIPSSAPPAATRPAALSNVAASMKRPSFASREDVFPCAACGEVFSKAHLLDLHQASRHAFSELSDGDSGKNIVQIIFQSGWKGRGNKASGRSDDASWAPVVHRVLKIHNSAKTIARFEEYREWVRSRAAARWAAGRGGGGEERCLADGNERLRFYCTTFLCGLGREGNLGTCGSPFCATCGIVRHGFSGKNADGVATHGTGWGAHASLPEELEREFEFMHVSRAMLVCRVVAGRVALGNKGESNAAADEERDGFGGVYDSAVAAGRGGGSWTAEDVLLAYNPRAVLPCFVIIYSV